MKDMDTVFLKLKVEKGRLRYCGIDVSTPTETKKIERNATPKESKLILKALHALGAKLLKLNFSARITEKMKELGK